MRFWGVSRRPGGSVGVVAAQSITVINSPIFGIDGVSNPQATGFQSAGENDAELRSRIRRSLEGAGRATPGALVSALTTIPGLRDKDVQILEDPVSRPGLIQVNVALPQLAPGNEAQLLTELAEQAVGLIEEVRPVGVRIVHNIDAPKPIGPGEAGPGVQAEEVRTWAAAHFVGTRAGTPKSRSPNTSPP